MATEIVRLSALALELKRSKSSLRNDIRSGTFPAPISLGKRAKGFLRSEIDAWLVARAEARDAQKGGAGAEGAQ